MTEEPPIALSAAAISCSGDVVSSGTTARPALSVNDVGADGLQLGDPTAGAATPSTTT